MDRRAFITMLASAFVGIGCQTAKPTTRHLASDDEAPRVAPTLSFPKPATAVPTSAPLEQDRVLPVPTAQTRTFSTRTMPPERLIIPSIGVDSRVVPLGTIIGKTGSPVWETAAFAVGHHRGSSNPGEPGNLVMSGHISSPHEGGVFSKLPRLESGSGVIVVTPQQHYMYIVRDIQTVKPTAVEVLNPTATAIATLITCVPDGVYTHRLVVRCDAV